MKYSRISGACLWIGGSLVLGTADAVLPDISGIISCVAFIGAGFGAYQFGYLDAQEKYES